MKHSLSLEFVGENRHFELSMHKKHGLKPPAHLLRPLPRKPWVAEILGYRIDGGFERQFLRGQKDYSKANGSGSSGVKLWFFLDDNKIYEVHAPKNWTKFARYFCRFNGFEKQTLTREEVIRCLNGR